VENNSIPFCVNEARPLKIDEHHADSNSAGKKKQSPKMYKFLFDKV
jgi:hypothetical protein